MQVSECTSFLRAGVIKEIAIMRTLEEHPNTVRLIDVYDEPDTFVLVMELCSGEPEIQYCTAFDFLISGSCWAGFV